MDRRFSGLYEFRMKVLAGTFSVGKVRAVVLSVSLVRNVGLIISVEGLGYRERFDRGSSRWSGLPSTPQAWQRYLGIIISGPQRYDV